MTFDSKTGAILTTILAILTLLLGTQSLIFFQWLFGEFHVLFGLPLFEPVLLAVIVGAIVPAWLPHALPQNWPAYRTKRVTRLLGFWVAFFMVVIPYRSMVGVQYGLFAGTGSYALWTAISNMVYRHFPQTKPDSLSEISS